VVTERSRMINVSVFSRPRCYFASLDWDPVLVDGIEAIAPLPLILAINFS